MGRSVSKRRLEALIRAMVLLNRYSDDITTIAHEALSAGLMDNRSIHLLLTIAENPGITPSELADKTAVSRSGIARSLSQMSDAGFLLRRADASDGRIVRLGLSAKGRRHVRTFASRLADYFQDGAPLVKESLHELGISHGDRQGALTPVDPVQVALKMSAAGAAYVEALAITFAPGEVPHGTDLWALVLIKERGSMRPSTLQAELGITSGAVSILLQRLEDQSLIRRDTGGVPGDKRATVIELSPHGMQVVRRLARVFQLHSDEILGALMLTLR